MVAVNQQLEDTLSQAVVAMDFEWVGCEWVNDNGRQILRIYIDTEQGVTIGQCVKATRELGAILEVEDITSGRYRLEVSSPGVERPLFRSEHYAVSVGKRIALKRRIPDEEGRRRFKGVIQSVTDESVTLDADDVGVKTFAYSQIERASLVVDI